MKVDYHLAMYSKIVIYLPGWLGTANAHTIYGNRERFVTERDL